MGIQLAPSLDYYGRDGANVGACLLDRMSAAPVCAYSTIRKLKSTATLGYQVIRASDSASKDVGFRGLRVARDLVPAHCGASNGTIAAFYDQSGNGRSHLQGNTTQRPKIFDSSTGMVQAGSTDAMLFDGVNDSLDRSDAYGISGNAAVTVCSVFQMAAVNQDVIWCFGGTANNSLYGILFNSTDSANVYAWQNSTHREFTVAGSVTSAPRRWILTSAASGDASTNTCSEDGSALSQSGLANGSKNITNSAARLGCYTGDTNYANAYLSFYAVWNSILSAADTALVQAEMMLHT